MEDDIVPDLKQLYGTYKVGDVARRAVAEIEGLRALLKLRNAPPMIVTLKPRPDMEAPENQAEFRRMLDDIAQGKASFALNLDSEIKVVEDIAGGDS
jgi:hypothetical protein